MAAMERKLIGRWGEAAAAEYLRKKGYKIIAQGYHSRFGEVDLIAANKKFVAFVEVKTRKSASFARAMEYVDANKQRKLAATASLWLSENATKLQPRLDVIEVYYTDDGGALSVGSINHIENAFGG